MKSCQSGVQGSSSSGWLLGPEKVGRGLLAADEKRIGGRGLLGWGGGSWMVIRGKWHDKILRRNPPGGLRTVLTDCTPVSLWKLSAIKRFKIWSEIGGRYVGLSERCGLLVAVCGFPAAPCHTIRRQIDIKLNCANFDWINTDGGRYFSKKIFSSLTLATTKGKNMPNISGENLLLYWLPQNLRGNGHPGTWKGGGAVFVPLMSASTPWACQRSITAASWNLSHNQLYNLKILKQTFPFPGLINMFVCFWWFGSFYWQNL